MKNFYLLLIIVSSIFLLSQSCKERHNDDNPVPNPTTLTIHVKSISYVQGELFEDRNIEGAIVCLYPNEEDRLNNQNIIKKMLTNS